MTHHTCTSCGNKIDNGKAVIRSISFEQVAYHQDCWEQGAVVSADRDRLAS